MQMSSLTDLIGVVMMFAIFTKVVYPRLHFFHFHVEFMLNNRSLSSSWK